MDPWSPYGLFPPSITANSNDKYENPSMIIEYCDLNQENPWLGNKTNLDGKAKLPQDGFSDFSNTAATIPQENACEGSKKKPIKDQKPRLKCQQPRCNSTFPRKYELARHERNVHNRSFTLLCPVYGCNRTTKPLGRPDKFQEHMRKHRQSERYLCVIEDCRKGPFTRIDLGSHLNSDHREPTDLPYVKVIFRALNLRSTEIEYRVFVCEDSHSCPLAFLGCTFVESEDTLSKHLWTHELVERSRGYLAIRSAQEYWGFGSITCPMCKNQLMHSIPCAFLKHAISNHSPEERAEHALEISEMLQPYLIHNAAPYSMADDIALLRKEFEASNSCTGNE